MSLLDYIVENVEKERTFDDISKLMTGRPSQSNPRNDLPISANEGILGWDIVKDPERLRKTYVFDHAREVIFFVNEMYKYSLNIHHTIKILIEDLEVTVTTTTHDFSGVTKQDHNIAKMANELYSDTRYFKNDV